MIITRTPFRISFFGGGTDFPSWFKHEGGEVLSSTIDKYCYITCRNSTRRPIPVESRAVRAVLDWCNVDAGLEITHDGDLPARSGMGASSALTVGLLRAVTEMRGEYVSPQWLAESAMHLEQVVLRECVGCQDQVAASFGGFNHVVFGSRGGFEVRPVTLPPERLRELEESLVLVHSGISRDSSEHATTFLNHLASAGRELRRMSLMVRDALAVLRNPNAPLSDFAALLDEAWWRKRSLSPLISNSRLDEIYQVAKDEGALGGKLLGAGGGGFMLFFVPVEHRARFTARLSPLPVVPFRFEPRGSHVIYREGRG